MRNDEESLFVAYGRSAFDMVRALMEEIDPLAGIDPATRVGIKPNLVVAKPASSGATTTPEIVEAMVDYAHSRGVSDITILESSWVGEDTSRAFDLCGYTDIAERTGAKLVDLKKRPSVDVSDDGYRLRVCSDVLAIDYLINVPVLKAHCQTTMTCALKNLKGCIPDSEKRRFHRLGLHEPIARLNKVIKADLIVVDALCGDLTFEEGGNPVRLDRVVVGKDPVSVDSYCAGLIGVDPMSVEYIRLAQQLGVGSTRIPAVVELGKPCADSVQAAQLPAVVDHLTRRVHQRQACSACFGGLVHALYRLRESGVRSAFDMDLYIGQGFRNVPVPGLGIGDCVNRASLRVSGCPPRAEEIVKALQELRDTDGYRSLRS